MVTEKAPLADHDQMMRELQAYGAASQQLNAWIAGAQALGLLRGALTSGVFDAARSPRTAEELAAVTGNDEELARHLCVALTAHGVFTREADTYSLAPDFAILAAPTAPQRLVDAVGLVEVMVALLATPGHSGDYRELSMADTLAFAKGAVSDPVSPLRQALVVGYFNELLELRDCWAAGARHIEFGCGIGRTLIGAHRTDPNGGRGGAQWRGGGRDAPPCRRSGRRRSGGGAQRRRARHSRGGGVRLGDVTPSNSSPSRRAG